MWSLSLSTYITLSPSPCYKVGLSCISFYFALPKSLGYIPSQVSLSTQFPIDGRLSLLIVIRHCFVNSTRSSSTFFFSCLITILKKKPYQYFRLWPSETHWLRIFPSIFLSRLLLGSHLPWLQSNGFLRRPSSINIRCDASINIRCLIYLLCISCFWCSMISLACRKMYLTNYSICHSTHANHNNCALNSTSLLTRTYQLYSYVFVPIPLS